MPSRHPRGGQGIQGKPPAHACPAKRPPNRGRRRRSPLPGVWGVPPQNAPKGGWGIPRQPDDPPTGGGWGLDPPGRPARPEGKHTQEACPTPRMLSASPPRRARPPPAPTVRTPPSGAGAVHKSPSRPPASRRWGPTTPTAPNAEAPSATTPRASPPGPRAQGPSPSAPSHGPWASGSPVGRDEPPGGGLRPPAPGPGPGGGGTRDRRPGSLPRGGVGRMPWGARGKFPSPQTGPPYKRQRSSPPPLTGGCQRGTVLLDWNGRRWTKDPGPTGAMRR